MKSNEKTAERVENSRPDLLTDATKPVTYKERTVGQYNLTMIWFGFAVQLIIFMQAGQAYPSNSVLDILIALVLGNTVPAIVIFFTQEIGIRYGLSYGVAVRAMFGIKGGLIPGWIRAIPAIFWFGFQTWVCAGAVDSVCLMIWNYTNITLWIIVFGILQIVTTFYGIRFIRVLNLFSSPALLVMGFILMYLLLSGSDMSLGEVLTLKGDGTGSLAGTTMAFIAGWSTLACSIQDIVKDCKVPDGEKTRWRKLNLKYSLAQWIGMIPASVLFGFIGVLSMALTGEWNPTLAIAAVVGDVSIPLAILCELFIVFATWTTNPGANLLNPAYVICATLPKKISFKKAVFIAGALGLIMMPWKASGDIQGIMNVIGGALGPVAGIMIADYIFIRKHRIAVADLYKSKGGGYYYWGGFNIAALVAYVVSVGVSMLFPNWIYTVGLFVALVIYTPLMKYWVMKKYPDSQLDYSYNETLL